MVSTRRSSANAVAKETQPMVRSIRDRHRTEALARGNPKFGPPPFAKGPPWGGPRCFTQIWDPRGGPGGANKRARRFSSPRGALRDINSAQAPSRVRPRGGSDPSRTAPGVASHNGPFLSRSIPPVLFFPFRP